MKKVLLYSILFCTIALSGIAELTDADLDKIRLIVQEEIKPQKDEIGTLKTDIAAIKTEVKNLKETVNTNFDAAQKNFDRQNNIIIACIGIPMAILAIGVTVWGILAAYRSKQETRNLQENREPPQIQRGLQPLTDPFAPQTPSDHK